jgi:L-iditol 2-dehydrogenase
VKALRLHGVGDLRLADEAPPEPGDGELLLRVKAVGLCGSDRHWFVEGAIGDAAVTRPLVLGHELVAVVDAGVRAGERVAVDPSHPCGTCEACAAGMPHLCLNIRFAGHGTTDGALRELMVWPERLVFPISERIPDHTAPLLEPLGVALHALDLGKARPGTTAGVFGCGPLGLLIIQALHAVGALVAIATDVLPHRIDAARALGVPLAVSAGTTSPPLDVAFEVAGEEAALDDAIAATRPGGRVVVVGIPSDDRTSFTASVARRKGLTLLICRRMRPEHLPHAIRLAESGDVDLAALLTARYRLDDWPQAFADLRDRAGHKVVVEPGELE